MWASLSRYGVRDSTRPAPSASGALEDHDRDAALGLALVVVVGRPGGGHGAPHLRLLGLGRGPRAGREALVEDLDLDVGIGLEVDVPRGRLVRTALRGDDQVVGAEGLVDQRRGAALAAATPGGRQQQDRRALPVVTLRAAGLPVAAHVLFAEQHRAGTLHAPRT